MKALTGAIIQAEDITRAAGSDPRVALQQLKTLFDTNSTHYLRRALDDLTPGHDPDIEELREEIRDLRHEILQLEEYVGDLEGAA